MRPSLAWWSTVPVAGLFVWLGVATLNYPVLATSCFLAALVIFPEPIKKVVGWAEEAEGWKRRLSYGLLAVLFLLICVVVVTALTVDRQPPPGSR